MIFIFCIFINYLCIYIQFKGNILIYHDLYLCIKFIYILAIQNSNLGGVLSKIDLNSIRKTMFAYCYECHNAPISSNGYLIQIQSYTIGFQYYIPYQNGSPEYIYYRQLLSDESWTPWTTSIEQYAISMDNAYFPASGSAYIGSKKLAIVTFKNYDGMVLYTSKVIYDSWDPYVLWNQHGLRITQMYDGATSATLTWI